VAGTVLINALNLDGAVQLSKPVTIDAAPDTRRACSLPEIATLSPGTSGPAAHHDAGGDQHELYWLSTKTDEPDCEVHVVRTPVKSYADVSRGRICDRPPSSVVEHRRSGAEGETRVTLTNTGTSIAFFVRLQVTKGAAGDEILPVLWEDNYVSLMPGERRELRATYRLADLGAARPAVKVTGWNVR
jgi:exo-1,4-beta-D-glucosaminidase